MQDKSHYTRYNYKKLYELARKGREVERKPRSMSWPWKCSSATASAGKTARRSLMSS